ncbi:MAG: hypothetical protein IK126_09610 [Bacteroidales bacterium]|nr:hypothetical protein [Bacteroidales bacterium]
MKRTFNLSANIENGFAKGSHYIVTPNAKKAISHIVNGFKSGVHSYTIIGTYGTGKSSFLLAMENDLLHATKKPLLFDPQTLSDVADYEILNIVGDYCELLTLLQHKLNNARSGESVIDTLDRYYKACKKQGKFLVIVIDEFGKILEHAAKNNPEKELYFLQQFAEYVNDSSRQILFLTTLHQNFGSYAKNLTEEQKNEWKKVKGRFMEVTFVEPIEQLLHLASVQLKEESKATALSNAKNLYKLAIENGFVDKDFDEQTALQLYPLDLFSAYTITSAIQRYGQNERSLFSFLSSRGEESVLDFCPEERLTYNLAKVYDYITYNFQSTLNDANADSMSWATLQHSIERVEKQKWESNEQAFYVINLIKALGLLNTFGNAGFHLNIPQFSRYAKWAMNIPQADKLIRRLIEIKVVRYAEYKERLVLFEGTDVNLESEFHEAGLIVPRPVYFIDKLRQFFNQRIAPVKAHFYQKGTPRFFDYKILEAPERTTPDGDIDGYIELIFSTKKNALKDLKDFSASTDIAIIFAYFKETENLVNHLYNIDKYEYLLKNVVIETDNVARGEFKKLLEHEQDLLNKELSDCLFSYNDKVEWIYNGEEQDIHSHRDFNKLLSRVCNEVYCKTPVMNNELFNRHKLSGSIMSARKNYLAALIGHNTEEDLGFPDDKFPPEKTIYYSLLKDTRLHQNGEFTDNDIKNDFQPLWDASEEFLQSTINKPRRISELINTLLVKPYKVKQGLLDFWIPTYLFIRRQDFALYDATRGSFIPNVNMEFFDLLQKHPRDFQVKKFAVDGVKLSFFNQYRRFVNLGDEFSISTQSFIETIKPFLNFYVRLNDYTKHTRKFNHLSTMHFRDVLAKAKDPEQAFFEDLPDALGFDRSKLKDEQTINEYGQVIERAIRELRTCYTNLIDRIEERLVDEFGLDSGDYSEYITEIHQRLANVKTHLLTGKQKEFYHHVMTEYDNRTQWYQSICYTILDQRLDTLRDEQEDKLVDDLVYMFRECEKYSDISRKIKDSDNSEAYSFDMVTNQGTNIRTQTYILPERDRKQSSELEEKINRILSGNNNVDICTLLSLLNKKMKGGD